MNIKERYFVNLHWHMENILISYFDENQDVFNALGCSDLENAVEFFLDMNEGFVFHRNVLIDNISNNFGGLTYIEIISMCNEKINGNKDIENCLVFDGWSMEFYYITTCLTDEELITEFIKYCTDKPHCVIFE